jgi:hypothetical protein
MHYREASSRSGTFHLRGEALMLRQAIALPCIISLLLCACATARMHSETELNSVATTCGLALGQLAQDEEEKRLLFIMQDAPTGPQRTCITQWARRNHLKTVIIEGVEFAQ